MIWGWFVEDMAPFWKVDRLIPPGPEAFMGLQKLVGCCRPEVLRSSTLSTGMVKHGR